MIDSDAAQDDPMEALPDLVWRILLEKGVQLKYETWNTDAMPKPKREFLLEKEAWDQLVQAILEAMEVLKVQAVKDTQPSYEGPWIRKSDQEQRNYEFKERF